MKPISEQGYLIVAIDFPGKKNYVTCASKLAHSILRWHANAEICLLTNTQETVDSKLFKYQQAFPLPLNLDNAFSNDWQIFHATPFRETIKIEADCIVTSPIEHWWTMLRHRDLVVSTGCRNWKDQVTSARQYRQIFDHNALPDVYNAITYWRRSELAKEFFDTVQTIFENWSRFKTLLKFPEAVPSTDVVYAMACKILGPERTTLPFASYPRMVHMKKHITQTQTDQWIDELVLEHHDYTTRIQTLSQWGLLHHGVKRGDLI